MLFYCCMLLQCSKENTVARLISTLSWIILVASFVNGILLGAFVEEFTGDFNFILALAAWLTGVMAWALLLGFSEVIQLLDSNADKGFEMVIDKSLLSKSLLSENAQEPTPAPRIHRLCRA